MFDKLEDLVDRLDTLNNQLTDPDIVSDQNKFRKLMKEQSELTPIVEKYKEYKDAKQTIEDSLLMLEEENDEDYYERIHAEFQDSQFYVANDADYIKWAKEVPGIGDCIVEPAVEGPGTVGLILVDSNGQPASSTLVTAVYNHIVSPDDRSKRLLPTGSSKLIVKSATVKTVDFACTGLVLDGVGLDDVISTFKTEMMAVYSAAKETNILRYNSARTVLSTITGVSDFIDFTMDGKRENIHLSSSEYADTGNVTFTLEGAET